MPESVARFLQTLRETGRAQLASSAPPTPEALAGARRELLALDKHARQSAPGDAPMLSLPAATWAAGKLYEATAFLVFRDVGHERVESFFEAATAESPCGQPTDAATIYSVDLCFRWLPDLLTLARRIDLGDPLVGGLVRLVHRWPLSSVGVGGLDAPEPTTQEAITRNPCLLQIYADRILEHGDESRLASEPVREAVRRSCGIHAELAGSLAKPLGFKDSE